MTFVAIGQLRVKGESFIIRQDSEVPKNLKPLKRKSRLQQTTNFATSFLINEKNKV